VELITLSGCNNGQRIIHKELFAKFIYMSMAYEGSNNVQAFRQR